MFFYLSFIAFLYLIKQKVSFLFINSIFMLPYVGRGHFWRALFQPMQICYKAEFLIYPFFHLSEMQLGKSIIFSIFALSDWIFNYFPRPYFLPSMGTNFSKNTSGSIYFSKNTKEKLFLLIILETIESFQKHLFYIFFSDNAFILCIFFCRIVTNTDTNTAFNLFLSQQELSQLNIWL